MSVSSFIVTLFTLFISLPSIFALYNAKGDVLQLGADNFKEKVLKHDGIVIVEFYAPWCGHCKSLAPEYEKAASTLKGVVRVVAVDATAHESLAQKYQIQGFPTIKVFAADKSKPVDYQGQRTADGIISEAMKAVTGLVKSRGGKGGSSSGSSGKDGSGKKKKGSKENKSAVVELNEASFNALVLDSKEHWLVEFYAPWCGHCKALAPKWKEAAGLLAKDGVKLGAVDATANPSLAQRYGVQGYPSIKVFAAGNKEGGANYKPTDYQGPREASDIVNFALAGLDAAGAPVTLQEITSSTNFVQQCDPSVHASTAAKLCVVLFLPHILDSQAKGRKAYLESFAETAKSFRKMPFAFLWTASGSQPGLEEAFSVNGNFPTVAVVSLEKGVYAVNKLSWSTKNVQAFLDGVLSGSEKTTAFVKGKEAVVQGVMAVSGWDGKDGQLETEEIPLDQLFGEDEL